MNTISIKLPKLPHSDHYELVGKAIQFIRENQFEQPSIESIARHVGLSKQHLNEVFREWTGTTPKQLLRAITYVSAKRELLSGSSTTDSAMNLGLSGSSRLYDLCVNLEAATPGEIKSLGKGMVFEWGIVRSPFGKCLLVKTARGLSHLFFIGEAETQPYLENIRKQWPLAEFKGDESALAPYANAIFFGAENMDLKIFLRGTPFQLKVWEALLRIDWGTTTAYSELAAAIGRPKAHRACASAVGENPISYLIPCHRVLRKSLGIGGYRWGVDRKCAILSVENSG